jgi:hypothetical protein
MLAIGVGRIVVSGLRRFGLPLPDDYRHRDGR